MENIIEEMRKKQYGYTVAKEAIEKTKPSKVDIKKENETGGITVSFYPETDALRIVLNSSNTRYESSVGNIPVSDAKLILEALEELFKEDL